MRSQPCALTTALKDESNYVRWQSASALGKIGPAAAKAVPALIEMLRHNSDERARGDAADALGSIDADTAVPVLAEALKDDNWLALMWAADAVRTIGPAAREAAPALRELTRNPNPGIRQIATEALRKVNDKPPPEKAR